ncbi:uncharacterized protein LOC116253538 [Nymphaea colorata]|nr:uncharacterized protein LOC116253538 [Nymphaea colorata]
MESEPLVVDIFSSDDEETCQRSAINWPYDLIGNGVGPDGVEAVGELPPCLPIKQNQRHSDDKFSSYSLCSEQSCVSESESNSDDDCLILDGDPDKPNATMEKNCDGSGDLVVISEKGQVACRDFPHPRHLCVRFPFKTSPHEKHCDLCHCYVCDSPAPCVYWGTGFSSGDHCHSSDSEEKWRTQRKAFRLAQLPSAISSKSMETALSRVSSPYSPGYPLSPSSSTSINSVPVQSPVSRASRHGSSPSSNSVAHPTSITGDKRGNQSPLSNSKNRFVQSRRRNIKELTQKVPCATLSRLQKQQNYCSSRFVPIAATLTQAINCARNYGQKTVTPIAQENHRPLLRPSDRFYLRRIEHFLLSDDDLNADDSQNLRLSGNSTHDWGILYSTCRNDNASNPSLASHPTHACPLAGSSTTRSGCGSSNTTKSASSFGSQFQTNTPEDCQTPTGGMVDPPGSGSYWVTDTAPFASPSSPPDLLNLDLPKIMDAVLSDPCNSRITSGVAESQIEATVFESQSNNRDLVIGELNYRPPDSLLDPYTIGLIQEAHGNGNW